MQWRKIICKTEYKIHLFTPESIHARMGDRSQCRMRAQMEEPGSMHAWMGEGFCKILLALWATWFICIFADIPLWQDLFVFLQTYLCEGICLCFCRHTFVKGFVCIVADIPLWWDLFVFLQTYLCDGICLCFCRHTFVTGFVCVFADIPLWIDLCFCRHTFVMGFVCIFYRHTFVTGFVCIVCRHTFVMRFVFFADIPLWRDLFVFLQTYLCDWICVLFLAHLSWKFKWAILIARCPSVRPSVCL
jgi:hypothetical protein